MVFAEGNGQLEYEQKHVYAGSERIEQFTDKGNWERTLYVHEDVMGSTRYYTKANGQSFAELTYDAWGMPQSPNKLLNNDHGNYVFATFTGHIYDTTLDIYFAEARFYDANNRTWLAMDPIKDGGNWYQYCYGDPIDHFDPNGKNAVLVYVFNALINGTVEGVLGFAIDVGGQLIEGNDIADIDWGKAGISGGIAFVGGTVESLIPGDEAAGVVFAVIYTMASSKLKAELTGEKFKLDEALEDSFFAAAASLLPTGSTKTLRELGIDDLPRFASDARNPLIWRQAFTLNALRDKISWAKLVEQIGWIRRGVVEKFSKFNGS